VYLQGGPFGPAGLPRCNMQHQQYMTGEWEMIPRQCWPADNLELGEFGYAYDFERNCNDQVHLCKPGASMCGLKAPVLARWRWQSALCSLLTFSAELFSAKIGNRFVVFVGDSLMVEQFESLKALMESQITRKQDWDFFETVHGGRFQVTGAWHLVGHGNESNPSHMSHIFSPMIVPGWRSTLSKADILVMNTGHHWHRVDPQFESYHTMVENVMLAISLDFHGSDIVFRTSTWGHHDCATFSTPVKDVPNADHDPYSWLRAIYADSIWSDMAPAHLPSNINFHVVNTSLTMLRPDGHVGVMVGSSGKAWEDCLHNCLPGPADYWNWLLYNALVS